jgi:limonene-1,2-epoxide hydrolase
MGRTEDIIWRNYEAFQRGDIDGVLRGWDRDGLLVTLGGRDTYRGHDELRRYLEKDIHEAPEFEFRVYNILELGNLALTFGRYSVREDGGVVERGVFCLSRAEDQRLVSWETYENVGEAFREFKRRLDDD